MNNNIRIRRAARALVTGVSKIGTSKKDAKTQDHTVIRSIGTQRGYECCVVDFFRWRTSLNVSLKDPVTTSEIVEYLYERAAGVAQKTVDQARQALQAVYRVSLPRVESELPSILVSRAISDEDIARIAGHQCPMNSFATQLALSSGVRAHELFTLLPASERDRSSHRDWDSRIFIGRPKVVVYSVVGKGGLCRWVGVEIPIANALETYRLLKPREMRDRRIYYRSHYAIGGGQAWSQSFSAASVMALGRSNGAHGVRHSFAQKRFRTLVAIGLSRLDALGIVAQELGHFRPHITLSYFR